MISRFGAPGCAAVLCAALLVAGGCRNGPRDARETGLRENLSSMRAMLQQYRSDKGRFPESLEDLVHEGYMRTVPMDPMTNSRDTWKAIYKSPGTPAPGEVSRFAVTDVRSGAEGNGSDGRPYGSW